MRRELKIDRLKSAGWKVRWTSNEKRRIVALRKGVEHRGSVNKVHESVFGY